MYDKFICAQCKKEFSTKYYISKNGLMFCCETCVERYQSTSQYPLSERLKYIEEHIFEPIKNMKEYNKNEINKNYDSLRDLIKKPQDRVTFYDVNCLADHISKLKCKLEVVEQITDMIDKYRKHLIEED